MNVPNPHVAEVSNATARELVLAKAQAIYADYDGCFERIAEWWAQEEWEREAQPQEFPYSEYEDAAGWVLRARAGLAALDSFDDPDVIGGRRVLPQVGEHHTRQEIPWPPHSESTYMLTKWVCTCGWESLTVTDSRGNPALEAARNSATRHEAASSSTGSEQ